MAQYFNWPFVQEGKPAISTVLAKAWRKPQSWKLEAAMKAMPLEPALTSTTGITAPESMSRGPCHEAGHSTP